MVLLGELLRLFILYSVVKKHIRMQNFVTKAAVCILPLCIDPIYLVVRLILGKRFYKLNEQKLNFIRLVKWATTFRSAEGMSGKLLLPVRLPLRSLRARATTKVYG